MKRQQVISRFFASKPTSSASSTQSAPSPREASVIRPAAAATVEWPPRGQRNLTHESLPSSSSKKRALYHIPSGGDEGENAEPQSRKRRSRLIRKAGDRDSREDADTEFEEVHEDVMDRDDPEFFPPAEEDQLDDTAMAPEDPDFSAGSTVLRPCSGGDGGSENQPKRIALKARPNAVVGSSIRENCLQIVPSDPVKHKRFVEKLLARIDENGEVKKPWYGSPPTGKEKLTPLEVQVVELKAKYPDVVLMVEVGYRYRFFGDDAETAARTLGIFAHYDHNFLTASIPTFRLHFHVRRLVEAGLKVGVVRQTETAAIKAHGSNKAGPFTRGLSALYTRATINAAEDLGGKETEGRALRLSSYLMCIAEMPVQGGKKSLSKKAKALGSGILESQRDVGAGNGSLDTEFGVVAVEAATGDVMFGNFKDCVVRTELEGLLLTCAPAELLLASPLSSTTEKLLRDFAGPAASVRVERVSRDCFKDGGALAEVLGFYESKGDHEEGDLEETKDDRVDKGMEVVMAMPDIVLQALALALRYLQQFNLEKVLRLGAAFRPFSRHNEMNLSPNALRQLEILKNNTDGSEKGSLLWLLDNTRTSFGARLLQYWVTHPLCDPTVIAARSDAVTEMARDMGSSGAAQTDSTFPARGKGDGTIGGASRGGSSAGGRSLQQGLIGLVLGNLGRMPDLERGITRIFHRTATAAEFVSVIQALLTAAKQLQRLQFQEQDVDAMEQNGRDDKQYKRIRSPLLQRLVSTVSSATLCEHATHLLSALNTDAATAGDKLNLFNCKDGRFPEVDNCRQDIKVAEKEMNAYLPSFRKLLRAPNLQYVSINGLSHLVEAPVAQRVPGNWMKVNGTKKINRYHPPEVLESRDKLALAQEELAAACTRAWEMFLAEFSSHYVEFRAAVQAFAALDCLHSLAAVSRNQGYTRPEFVGEDEPSQLVIESGRHPILDSTLQDAFVPNNTFLDAREEQCQIITGPNMGGKSCYIRQVALIAIMAQVGSYVPASSAKLHAFDSVQTRMGASDSLQKGSSTFFEELSETSTILRTATARSLVILDELGRGTSTHDGVAIAYATLHHLLKETQCLTLFVTHYPKIAELKSEFPGKVNPYYVSYMAHERSQSKEVEDHELAASIQLMAHESAVSSELATGTTEMVDNLSIISREGLSEATQTITFLYKLVPGVASRSFGLYVARLAQIPEACVLHAATMAAEFEKDVRNRGNPMFHANCSGMSANSGTMLRIDVDGKSSKDFKADNSLGSEGTRTTFGEEAVNSYARNCPEAGNLIDGRDGECHLATRHNSRTENGNLVGKPQVRRLVLSIRNALKQADDIGKCLSLLKDIQLEAKAAMQQKEVLHML